MRCSKSDPRFGPVCACGGSKSKQAFTCQTCHNVVRGYGTVSLKDQNRKWRQTYFGIVAAVGDEDEGLIHRSEELGAARQSAAGELAELVAEQERDERIGHIARRSRWMLSLDDVDQYGRSLHELVAA